MTITKYESRTGGKFCKQPLRRVPSTPYDRPPTAARGISELPQANEAGRRWFSKLVDPVAHFIGRSASRFFWFIYVKDLPATAGENFATVAEASVEKSTFEVREQSENSIDITLSICYDRSEASKQKLISHIGAIFQLEQQLTQIHEENSDSPIEIARAYLRRNGKKLVSTPIASKSTLCIPTTSEDFQNNYMTQKPRGRSALYKMARSPSFGSSMMNNPMKYSPYEKNNIKSLMTQKLSNSSSNIVPFGPRLTLKRGSSDRDDGCFDEARRVRQKILREGFKFVHESRKKNKKIEH